MVGVGTCECVHIQLICVFNHAILRPSWGGSSYLWVHMSSANSLTALLMILLLFSFCLWVCLHPLPISILFYFIFSVLTFCHVSIYAFSSGQYFCLTASQLHFFSFFFLKLLLSCWLYSASAFFFLVVKHYYSNEEQCGVCYLLKGFLSISNNPKLSLYSLSTQFCSCQDSNFNFIFMVYSSFVMTNIL